MEKHLAVRLLLVSFFLSALACAQKVPIVINKTAANCSSGADCGLSSGDNKSMEDADNDGDSDKRDCAPLDRSIRTGTIIPCQATCGSGNKRCQADGQFSSCDCSPVCEATGTGKCYYVSPNKGNDTNSGSYSSPWQSTRNFAHYDSDSRKPTGWVSLNAGDVVYLQSGEYKTPVAATTKESAVIVLANLAGRSDAFITIKAYPGAIVAIAPTKKSEGLIISNSHHVSISGLNIVGAYRNALRLENSQDLYFSDLAIKDTYGDDIDSVIGARFIQTTSSRITHSLFYNNPKSDLLLSNQPERAQIMIDPASSLSMEYNSFVYASAAKTKGPCLLSLAPRTALSQLKNTKTNCLDSEFNAYEVKTGLIYSNGIEPGDPAICEAPMRRSCYWVDAHAPEGGIGTFEKPFNSFEKVAGYMTEAGDYVPGLIQGGDYLYVKGTFAASQHKEETNSMRIRLERGYMGGTVLQPTVIKSWRGSPRAVFDGEDQMSDLIKIRGTTSVPFGAIRIQNIETTRAYDWGINIDEGVAAAELVSIEAHDTVGNGISGYSGGIFMKITDLQHDYRLHNCLVYNNKRNQVGGDNNIGGISILSEPSAQDGAKITLFGNVIHDEVNAIRHKHSGNMTMIAYDNLIYNSLNAFHLRGYNNRISHNLIVDNRVGFFFDPANQPADWNTQIHNNSIYNTPTAVSFLAGDTTHRRLINFSSNIFYSDVTSPGIILLGRWSNEYFNINDWESNYNLFDLATSPSYFLYHQNVGKSFSGAMDYLRDESSVQGEVNFVSPKTYDLRLGETTLPINDLGAYSSGRASY